MNTLTNTTDLSMGDIVTLLGADCLSTNPTTTPSKARVAPVAFHDGHPIWVKDMEQSGSDVYELLATVSPDNSANYYGVITAGWASPVTDDDDDTPPSQHPERKRVELLIVVSRNGLVASALSMSGKDEMVIDEGKAQGALALAVGTIFA